MTSVYSKEIIMARYRKRRYKNRSSGGEDAFGLIALVVIAYLYTGAKDFTETYSFAVPLLIAAAITVVILIASLWWRRMQRAKHKYDAFTIADIDSMDGIEFEHYLADLLRKRGFTDVKLTEKYDLGVDIIARKNGLTWGIQAKCYSGTVKAAAVRQAYTALPRYKCDRAMVITNSTYSRPAQLLASDTKSVLVDRSALMEWVYQASRAKAQPGVILGDKE